MHLKIKNEVVEYINKFINRLAWDSGLWQWDSDYNTIVLPSLSGGSYLCGLFVPNCMTMSGVATFWPSGGRVARIIGRRPNTSLGVIGQGTSAAIWWSSWPAIVVVTLPVTGGEDGNIILTVYSSWSWWEHSMWSSTQRVKCNILQSILGTIYQRSPNIGETAHVRVEVHSMSGQDQEDLDAACATKINTSVIMKTYLSPVKCDRRR